jgi:cytochrome bd-type quinol oxidase subunit 2
MSPSSLSTAGVLLITVPLVAFGGVSLLSFIMRNVPGYLDNPVRRGLWRAGHAHAGVLVLFSLVAMLYVDQAALAEPVKAVTRTLIVAAPILMPLGFFLSVVRPDDTKPSRLIWLTVAGGACLAAGTLTLGIGLL